MVPRPRLVPTTLLGAVLLGLVACVESDDTGNLVPAGDTDTDADADSDTDTDADADADADADTDTDADTDSDLPLDGFGTISGACGELEAVQLQGLDPLLLRNEIDFGDLEFDYDQLSAGGQEVYDDGNLGGSSLYSEIFAYEVLYRCELAQLLQTESELVYLDEGGKKTDLRVEIDELSIGVSVTRAYGYPPDDPYTLDQARALLEDKLADVLLSSANVAEEHAWEKQILHVIAYAQEHADSVEEAWVGLEEDLQSDTVVLVTVTEGTDEYLY